MRSATIVVAVTAMLWVLLLASAVVAQPTATQRSSLHAGDPLPTEPCTLYVSSTGNDTSGTGTVTAPFATLNRALNATGTAAVPIGGTLTICLASPQVAVTPSNGPQRWDMPCATSGVAYSTLWIRSVSTDPTHSQTLTPTNGYLITICRSFVLAYVTLNDALTIEIQSIAPVGITTRFDSLWLTGNVQLTWDADHDQVDAGGRAPRNVGNKPLTTVGTISDDYPFYFTNSKCSALTLASASFPPVYPINAYNHGSGSMHIYNIWWRDSSAVGWLGSFASVDSDVNTDNTIEFVNITVLNNELGQGGLDVTGGDVTMTNVVFNDNTLSVQHGYPCAIGGHSIAVYNSKFTHNANCGALDVEASSPQGTGFSSIIILGTEFVHNTHFYNRDSNNFLAPPAVSIDVAAGTSVTITGNTFDCNQLIIPTPDPMSPNYNDTVLMYAPPVGYRVDPGVAIVRSVTNNKLSGTDCPITCNSILRHPDASPSADPSSLPPDSSFSPCGMFQCTNCPLGQVPTVDPIACSFTCATCGAGSYIDQDTLTCMSCSGFWKTSGNDGMGYGSASCNQLTRGGLAVIIVISIVAAAAIAIACWMVFCRGATGTGTTGSDSSTAGFTSVNNNDDSSGGVDSREAKKHVNQQPLLGTL